MDGRRFAVLFLLVVPAALLGLTVVEFHSNPVSIMVLLAAMLAGAFYLLTYQETFA